MLSLNYTSSDRIDAPLDAPTCARVCVCVCTCVQHTTLRNIIAGIPRTGKMEDDDVAKDCRVTWHRRGSPPDACSHMRGVPGTQSATHITRRMRARTREIMTRNLAPLISAGACTKRRRPQVIATVLINNKLTYANEAKRSGEI